MGNQGSTTRTLLKEITADDDDRAVTAEIVQLMWNNYNTCSLEHDARFTRVEPIYRKLFEPLFELFMAQERATLLIFFTNENATENNIGFIKQKEIRTVPVIESNENLRKLYNVLHDKAPGYKRYIMIRLYKEV